MNGDKKANPNYREYLTAFIGHGRDKFQKATITANISGACNIKHVKSRYEWKSTLKKVNDCLNTYICPYLETSVGQGSNP
jgi:hypothetical protein